MKLIRLFLPLKSQGILKNNHTPIPWSVIPPPSLTKKSCSDHRLFQLWRKIEVIHYGGGITDQGGGDHRPKGGGITDQNKKNIIKNQ